MKTNDKERKIGPKIQNTEMKTPNSILKYKKNNTFIAALHLSIMSLGSNLKSSS